LRLGAGLTSSRTPVERVNTSNRARIEYELLAVAADLPDVRKRTAYCGNAPMDVVVRNAFNRVFTMLRRKDEAEIRLDCLNKSVLIRTQ
jgi:hypothetical protein